MKIQNRLDSVCIRSGSKSSIQAHAKDFFRKNFLSIFLTSYHQILRAKKGLHLYRLGSGFSLGISDLVDFNPDMRLGLKKGCFYNAKPSGNSSQGP